MKNFFQNKKVLIAIIVLVIVIVLAIVLFVVMGLNKDKKKSDDNDSIKFSEKSENKTENKAENKTDNKTSNKTDNKTDNKVSSEDDDDIGGDIDKYYKDAAKKFAEAFMDSDDMTDFLENYVDLKAFVAYESIENDESKFTEVYDSIEDDDPKIEETREAFEQFPATYQDALGMIDAILDMATQVQDDESLKNQIPEEYEDLTEEDKLMVLKDIKEPKKSSKNSRISYIDTSYSWMGEEEIIRITFFDDVVIYMCDENGISLTETPDIDEPLSTTDDEEN